MGTSRSERDEERVRRGAKAAERSRWAREWRSKPRRRAHDAPRSRADDERRAAYGAAGVKRARTRYSWARVVADTETVYRQVLTRRSPVEVAR